MDLLCADMGCFWFVAMNVALNSLSLTEGICNHRKKKEEEEKKNTIECNIVNYEINKWSLEVALGFGEHCE